MRALANKLSKEDAQAKVALEPFGRKTLSFYRYIEIDSPADLRDKLYVAWEKLGILGRIYLAKEGINAQISVPIPNLEEFTEDLNSVAELNPVATPQPIRLNFALDQSAPSFWKLIIKIRSQVVADNLPKGSYDLKQVGEHLSPQEFNQALENGGVVVDMRNQYESVIGKFANAITPHSQTFSEELREVAELFKEKKSEPLLLYCTGGIRCEKASAFLLAQGFTKVKQLAGGIINYAQAVKTTGLESKFHGKNFVFDARLAEAVTAEIIGQCYTCQTPADTYDNCKNDTCHNLIIQCDQCRANTLGTCTLACQKIVALPMEEQIQIRKGHKALFNRPVNRPVNFS